MKKRRRIKLTPRHIAALSLAGVITYCKFARCYYWYAMPDVVATETMMLMFYQMWIKDPQAVSNGKYYQSKACLRKVFINHKQMFELAHKREEKQHISNTEVQCSRVKLPIIIERNKARIQTLK